MDPPFEGNLSRRFACVSESQYPMCAFTPSGMSGADASCAAFINSSLNDLLSSGAGSSPELLVTVMDELVM
eukprot:SAG22_NODE_19755_length_272_cov_0.572254_1_plen_70_part_01